MRRVRGDDGAVAVVVALLSLVLFGFAVLVVDVGALFNERRQLQNGADAAALAVAQACAGGDCGPYQQDARDFASWNALDSSARVEDGEVCGSVDVGLPPCADPPAGLAGNGYVRVTTRTRTTGGGTEVRPYLARVLDPTYTGTEVTARATVVWGAPAGVDAELALTFSQCEYDRLTKDADGNTVYATEPYDPALQRTIYFHDTTQAGTCPAGPSGADLPGGFGWLDADDDCTAEVEDGWVGDKTGSAASNDCKAALAALLGQTLLVPVFDQVNGLNGTNGEYRVWNYVGFVLTGYRFPGASYPSGSGAPCSASQTCIRGYFVEVVAPASGPVTSGPDLGVRVVQLVD